MKKRMISLLLALVMLVGMIPATSLTAFAAAADSVWVGGVEMTNGTYLANGATTTQTTKPSGGYAYYYDGTLTLNNYSYEGKGYMWDYGGYYACIYGPTSLNIVLNGSSRIAQTDGDTPFDCIYSLGDVVVSGTGSLTLTDGYSGIYTESNVTINGGTITVQDVSVGIITHDNVTVNGGAIHVTSEEYALTGLAGITINGGKLTLVSTNTVNDSTYYAMRSDSITIADGLTVKASTDPDGTLVYYVAADNNTYDRVVISAPDVYVGGVGMCDGDYLANGATATQTTKPSGGYAYYKNGTLTLKNYSYEGVGYKYDSEDDYYAVIYSKNDLTLELIGNNTLTQTESSSDMIYVDGANLTVGGDGKLTGTSGGFALYVDKDITINGGTVEVSTYYTSIISYGGEVIINDGDITAESEDRAGIYSRYDVTVNGGNVTATGGNGAIDYGSSGSFTVAEDMKIQASTTVDGELGEYVAANHDSYKKIVITPPDVYVGGVGMGDGAYLAVGATKTQTTKPSGGYAYYKDGELILNNYSYEGDGYLYISSKGYYAVIYSKIDLTLELIGNNTLTQTESSSDLIYVSGADLTVGGDGKLTGTSRGHALYADKDITINGGTVEVSTYYTSILSNGDVIINDGDMTAESEDRAAIYSYYDVTVNGGNVTAIGSYEAIDYGSFGSFTVAEDMKIQASTTVDGALGEYVAANHDSYKKIVIAPAPEVYVGGVGMYDGDYLAVGATMTTTTKPSGGYAYYKNGKLTLNNYSYEGDGYEYDSDEDNYAVIYSKNDLTLELIGNNTLTQTESSSDMIYVDGANLTVGGDGKLTGTSEGFALYADKDITINGGTVEVSTYYTSIISYGNVIINDGDFTAESDIRFAIYSYYDVTVNGGNVTVTGGNRAISCDDFTVAEGMKIQASTTVDGELGEYVAENHGTYKKIVIGPKSAGTLGDLDLDGDVDAYDLTALARHVGGIEPATGQALANADVDGDGDVDAFDLTKHARYVGGIITSWDQD